MSTERFQLDISQNEVSKAKLLYVSQSSFDSEWNSRLHTHQCSEIFYVTRGHGLFCVENEEFPIKEDDLVIVNPRVAHTEQGIKDCHCEYIVMGIEGLEFFQINQQDSKGYVKSNYYEFKHEVLFYIKTILLEIKNKDTLYDTLCQNLLDILIINLIRRSNLEIAIAPVEKVNKECVYIEKYIDAHFKEDITLDSLSEVTFLNKYYLVHAFKKHKGVSPINYLIQRRIEEAKMLLKTTNLPISEISNIIGFSSQSYFAQTFKKHLHVSPVQYRKLAESY